MARVQQKKMSGFKGLESKHYVLGKRQDKEKIFCNNLEDILSSYLAAPFGAVVILRQSQDA